MSKKIASLYAEISGDSSKLNSALAQSKTGLSSMKAGLSETVKSVTGFDVSAIGAAAAVGVLAKGISWAVSEAIESERATKQLNAVLKSTGGVSGMTTESVKSLSSSLSDMAAIDDDVITGASSLMLTFTSVGKEVFPQAMTAALDMSAALGQDLQSSVIQLGKALNDPITGLTALKRVGVSFTEDQKKMIGAMQESGDLMGAQKLILDELSKEFGGQAAAAADTYEGKLNKLKVTAGNLAETFGLRLIPYLTNAADAMNLLITWNDKVDTAMTEHAAVVLSTSASYEDYLTEMERVIELSGVDVKAMQKEGAQYAMTRTEVDNMVSSTRLLSQAEYENRNSMMSDIGVMAKLIEQSGYVPPALQAASDSTLELSDSLKNSLDPALATAGKSMDDIAKQAFDLQDKVGKATAGLAEAQANFAKSTGGDVASALKDAGVKGDDYRTVLTLIDGTLGSNLGRQEDYKRATEDLAQKYADGSLRGHDFMVALEEINTKYEPFNEQVTKAKDLLAEMQGKWEYFLQNTELDLHVKITTEGEIPDGAKSTAKPTKTNTGTQGTGGYTDYIPDAGAANGANFTVPAGYPNDSFMLGLTSGEPVKVGASATGNNTTIQQVNFYITNPNPKSAANEVVFKLAQISGASRIGA